MFTIRVCLAPMDPLDGLSALDERRRLRLPDGVRLRVGERENYYRNAPVTEGFARSHFSRTEVVQEATIPIAWLTPDDVQTYGPDGCYVRLRESLPESRIVELFLAAKMAGREIT